MDFPKECEIEAIRGEGNMKAMSDGRLLGIAHLYHEYSVTSAHNTDAKYPYLDAKQFSWCKY